MLTIPKNQTDHSQGQREKLSPEVSPQYMQVFHDQSEDVPNTGQAITEVGARLLSRCNARTILHITATECRRRLLATSQPLCNGTTREPGYCIKPVQVKGRGVGVRLRLQTSLHHSSLSGTSQRTNYSTPTGCKTRTHVRVGTGGAEEAGEARCASLVRDELLSSSSASSSSLYVTSDAVRFCGRRESEFTCKGRALLQGF